MYKTSALKCGKCPKFKGNRCEVTGRTHGLNDHCDIGSDEKEMKQVSSIKTIDDLFRR